MIFMARMSEKFRKMVDFRIEVALCINFGLDKS